jgi:protein-S-isoprenylcysteine O-methyltransferase Ste14
VNLQLRVPPPIWLLLCGSLMWGAHRALPLAHVIGPPANRVGWLLVVVGAAIIVTAMAQFRRAQTTINPTKPARTSALVRSGIFGYSRNPMYLGLTIVLAGWALLLGSLGPWMIVPLFIWLLTQLQIRPEEAVLSTLFGREYDEYTAQVGRWFGRKG